MILGKLHLLGMYIILNIPAMDECDEREIQALNMKRIL